MISIIWVIILSTFWFLILVGIKNIFNLKFCSVCVAVSSTWAFLLLLKFIGLTVDVLLIAVLMGQSAVGLYYYLEKKVPKDWLVFRWPYLISAAVVVYVILGNYNSILKLLFLISILWLSFYFVFAFRNFPKFKLLTEKLIACCRDW